MTGHLADDRVGNALDKKPRGREAAQIVNLQIYNSR
jgi:hypothetical protein